MPKYSGNCGSDEKGMKTSVKRSMASNGGSKSYKPSDLKGMFTKTIKG